MAAGFTFGNCADLRAKFLRDSAIGRSTYGPLPATQNRQLMIGQFVKPGGLFDTGGQAKRAFTGKRVVTSRSGKKSISYSACFDGITAENLSLATSQIATLYAPERDPAIDKVMDVVRVYRRGTSIGPTQILIVVGNGFTWSKLPTLANDELSGKTPVRGSVLLSWDPDNAHLTK